MGIKIDREGGELITRDIPPKAKKPIVNNNKILLFLFLFLLCFWLLIGVGIINKYGHPSGSDAEYHYVLSKAWLSGANPLFDSEYFLMGSPYPPAFHLMIALFSKILFISPLTFMNLLEIILFPSVLVSVFYLAYKKTNLYVGLLSVLFLSSGIAFFDRGYQVIPQALDVLLFPLVVYFFLENKDKMFVLTSIFLVYNHGIYACLLGSSLFFYSILYNKKKLKEFGWILALSLPLFLLLIVSNLNSSTSYISSILTITSPQHLKFVVYPLYGVSYLGYFLSVFSFIGILYFATKEKTEFDKILVLWVLALMPLYPTFPDRFMSYVAQPLSIISSITMYELLKTERKRAGFLGAMFIIAVLNNLSWFYTLDLMRLNWIKPFYFFFWHSYRIIIY